MEFFSAKQRTINLQSGVTFSSDFQSGNLGNVQQKEPNLFHIWIEADPHSTYRTWFYFSVEGITQGTTVTFCIVKLFRQGHLPVFKSEKERNWARIKLSLQQNGIGKGEQGFQLTFKHCFTNKSKHYFAFSYPWTYTQNNIFIRSLVDNFKDNYFCDYRKLCLTSKKVQLNILTLTKIVEKNTVQIIEFKKIEQFQTFTFKNKKGIFISSRVHPGQVASSHMLNGILKYLFSKNPQADKLLQNFVFYIIPIVNPDGVIEGNFRCDSLGKNLNRFYTDPSPKQQPQIFAIKQFLLEMINSKMIHFCLDLHSHVNKQGVFMYGNSTNTLRQQLAVCLYPKLLEYNCKYFDYESCNFSQKNMSSKDRGDDLSKEGASRVAIYKQTGLVSCWTLQCNYNSCRTINTLPKIEEEMATKAVSNGLIADPNFPTKKQELVLLNVEQFEQIGANIAQTLLDYYKLRKAARYFGGKLKNASNFQLSLAVNILRMIPFKFDNQCRKIINAINSSQCLNQNYSKILQKIGLDPVAQYLSTKALKEKSSSKQKEQKVEIKPPQSLKNISSTKVNTEATIVSKQKRQSKIKSMAEKQKSKVAVNKILILSPNIPNIPRMAKKN